MTRARELAWATLGETGLILAVSALGLAVRQPLIFASLGPTAYELAEQPNIRSARVYNIVVGHLIAIGSGFLAVYLLDSWHEPNVIATGIMSTARLWAVGISVALTTVLTLAFRASQPAALATTLLISLGAMQTKRDAFAMIFGVLIIVAFGEPLRRLRSKQTGAIDK